MHKTDSAWWGLFLGCLLIYNSLSGLIMIDDGYVWRGAYIPIWTKWILLPVGIAITILSIRALKQGKGKPQPSTDEEAARAEAAMDVMYEREHGRPPDKGRKEG